MTSRTMTELGRWAAEHYRPGMMIDDPENGLRPIGMLEGVAMGRWKRLSLREALHGRCCGGLDHVDMQTGWCIRIGQRCPEIVAATKLIREKIDDRIDCTRE